MADTPSEIRRLEEMQQLHLSSLASLQLASSYLNSGDAGRVLQLIENIIEIFPEYATVYLIQAKALKELGRYEEALQRFEKVGEFLPRCEYVSNEIEELKRPVEEQRGEAPEQDLINKEDTAEDEYLQSITNSIKEYKPIRSSVIDDELPYMDNSLRDTNTPDIPIVSETLAEIFLQQKLYNRALIVYERLKGEKPEKANYYQEKIGLIYNLMEERKR